MERTVSLLKPSLKKCRVAVIRGGRSSEREISLETGRNVEHALLSRGHQVRGVDLDNELFSLLEKKELDAAFIALHGRLGEDGTIQGLLEIFGVPYTGSGVLSSALAMDKPMSKRIFESYGLPTPEWIELDEERTGKIPFDFPLVVKPACSGSTVGVSIVEKEEDLPRAVRRARAEDRRVFLEKYIKGKEITVGVLGNKDPFALPVILLEPREGFYDYRAKYTPGCTQHTVPAPLEKRLYEEAQSLAGKAHVALGCRGCSRVDMRLDESGRIFILELNTIPGMTQLSLLPEAAREAGVSFEDLVELLLQWGMES